VNFPCVRSARVVRGARLGTPLPLRLAAELRLRTPELDGPSSTVENTLAGETAASSSTPRDPRETLVGEMGPSLLAPD
jgi:hypothetical protein